MCAAKMLECFHVLKHCIWSSMHSCTQTLVSTHKYSTLSAHAMACRSPNIVQFYGASAAPDSVMLVTEVGTRAAGLHVEYKGFLLSVSGWSMMAVLSALFSRL